MALMKRRLAFDEVAMAYKFFRQDAHLFIGPTKVDL